MGKIVKSTIEMTKKQKFAKAGIAFVIGYVASEAAEKAFDVALTTVRKRKAAK